MGGVALLHDFWDLSSLTKGWTWAHGSESAESQPLDCQGVPRTLVLLLLMYLFSVALSLRCCAQVFSSCGEGVYSRVVGCRPPIAVASLVVGCHRHAGFRSAARGLSCSTACEIFPDQGSNPRALCWQTDS